PDAKALRIETNFLFSCSEAGKLWVNAPISFRNSNRWLSGRVDSGGVELTRASDSTAARKRSSAKASKLLINFGDILERLDQSHIRLLVLIHTVENAILIVIDTAVIMAQRVGKGDAPCTREFVAPTSKYFVSSTPQISRAKAREFSRNQIASG